MTFEYFLLNISLLDYKQINFITTYWFSVNFFTYNDSPCICYILKFIFPMKLFTLMKVFLFIQASKSETCELISFSKTLIHDETDIKRDTMILQADVRNIVRNKIHCFYVKPNSPFSKQLHRYKFNFSFNVSQKFWLGDWKHDASI